MEVAAKTNEQLQLSTLIGPHEFEDYYLVLAASASVSAGKTGWLGY